MRFVVQIVKPGQKDGQGRPFDEVWLADKHGRQSVIRFAPFPAVVGQVIDLNVTTPLTSGKISLAAPPEPPADAAPPEPPPATQSLGVDLSPESQVPDFVALLV